MHWIEFRDTAQKLAAGNTEGEFRSAVSRAYYAAFHYFREFLEQHEIYLGLPNEADAVLGLSLQNCGVSALKDVASNLEELRMMRLVADYRVWVPIGIGSCSKSLEMAGTILTEFDALLTTYSGKELAEKIKQYLTSIGRLRTYS